MNVHKTNPYLQEYILSLAIAVVIISAYGCRTNSTECLNLNQDPVGDTLLIGNIFEGIYVPDLNFVLISEKYLDGITEDSMIFEIRVVFQNQLDSNMRRVVSYVLKSDYSNEHYIDYISWIQDERKTPNFDRSLPYIIHPETGAYNRIKDGIVTRTPVHENRYQSLMADVRNITEWSDEDWNQESPIKYSVELLRGSREVYYGDCNSGIPESISKLFEDFDIAHFN